MLGLEPWQTVISVGLITVIFSAVGGFKGVVYTDFILFIASMIGAFAAAYYAVTLPEVGGLTKLMSNELVQSKSAMLPDFTNIDLKHVYMYTCQIIYKYKILRLYSQIT